MYCDQSNQEKHIPMIAEASLQACVEHKLEFDSPYILVESTPYELNKQQISVQSSTIGNRAET
jgi:hypothetical protein